MSGAGVLLTLLLGVAGCGGHGREMGDATLTIGAGSGIVEQAVLEEIYAQALEDVGYAVRRQPSPLGTGPAVEAMEEGQISGYPEHLDVVLTWLSGQPETATPADAQAAYEQAKEELEQRGLTAFPPTPFSFSNALVMLKGTARSRGLETLSDLEGKSEDVTITGVIACHGRLNCGAGLEQSYGLSFAGFVSGLASDEELFDALEAKQVDGALLPTTEGRLAAERGKFVALADDRHLFPAGNAIFVTTPKTVEEAGSVYEETIVEAQEGLTLLVMQELIAEVEIDGKSPKAVARGYLMSVGYAG